MIQIQKKEQNINKIRKEKNLVKKELLSIDIDKRKELEEKHYQIYKEREKLKNEIKNAKEKNQQKKILNYNQARIEIKNK